MPGTEDFDSSVERLAVLGDDLRRRLYRFVAASDHPVSRDEAADALGVPRHTVKFHLDKLVDEHLLDTEFKRLTDRRGPGAGRPAKLSRRAAGELAVSVPERHYDLAGSILAEAVRQAAEVGGDVAGAVRKAAEDEGRRQSSGSSSAALTETLSALGYEPLSDGSTITLRNCPFHSLAQSHTDLVCAMNRDFVAGVIDGAGPSEASAALEPEEGRCCVVVHLRPS